MKNWLLLLSMIAGADLIAQTFPYQISVDKAPYETLTNGTLLFDGANWDDQMDSIDLGFTVEIFGERTSRVLVEANGILFFEIDHPTNDFVAALPFAGADLIDKGAYTPSRSNLWYQIDGDPGDRIFKIEWNNAGFFDDGSAQDSCNFQCWIYESDNTIEMRYGASMVSDPSYYFYDNLGPYVGVARIFVFEFGTGTFFLLTGSVENPTLTETTYDDYNVQFPTLFDIPADSMVYRWKYMSVSTPTIEPFALNVQALFDNDNLIIRSNETTLMRYELMNSSGQTVKQGIVEPGFNHFSAADLSTGMYFTRLFDGHEKMKTVKAVKP